MTQTPSAPSPFPKRRLSMPPIQKKKPAGKSARRNAETCDDETSFILIQGAREHNLRNIDVKIPLHALSVVTGVSGSGKSTLAFDILFSTGQARFLECVNAYARQFIQPQAKPDVRKILHLPPTVAIEQRLSQGGWKSTVATATEIHTDLRMLFLTLGTQYCPDCKVPVEKQSAAQIVDAVFRRHPNRQISVLTRLVSARKGTYQALALWAKRNGYEHLRLDGKWVPTAGWKLPSRYRTHDIDLEVGTCLATERNREQLFAWVEKALRLGNGMARIAPGGVSLQDKAIASFGPAAEYIVSTARVCPTCGRSFETPDARLFSFHAARGRCPACGGFGAGKCKHPDPERKHTDYGPRLEATSFADAVREDAPDDMDVICPVCQGSRLNAEALAFRFHDLSIADFSRMTVDQASAWFADFHPTAREKAISDGILRDLRVRLSFLQSVGLGYLSLDRAVPTLSGGESQRIRLAAQLGSNLSGVCYVLDEPTIGLHPRDTAILLDTLCALRDKGNTIVLVEHDEQTMRRADWICDLGPGAGIEGGRLLAQGPLQEILRSPQSRTAECLRHPMTHPSRGTYRSLETCEFLTVRNASLHNLKQITVEIPLNRLTVVTGVSGSGKSTLVRNILYASLEPLTGGGKPKAIGCESIENWQQLKRVLEVDQSPIGRTPRSCPATYVDFWKHIRTLFASVPEARVRGWDESRFSFNLAGGRCPVCEGQGVVRSEMSFLPDVVSPCDRCNGARFNPETLLVRWNGKNIAEVLQMSVSEALDFFAGIPPVVNALQLLKDVGLGYLSLGQQSSTLSGGEAQRIKLVTELARCTPRPGMRQTPTLYVLDEPTVGLHSADIAKLLTVIHRLVDAGHTVVMIEHNTDVMLDADALVDLGPEGGNDGGKIVAAGALPVLLADESLAKRSHTLACLREELKKK